jgi:hypothetical protein
MLDNALCVGYLPGFLEHWLVVLRVLAVAVVLFALGEGNIFVEDGCLAAWVKVDVV